MKRRKGFTLIELLVVIAIIALLLAVLLPALSKVKERAKDLICRTNIKSIQLATILYTDSNEGKMPIYDFKQGLWVNLVTVYLDDIDDARYCPSTKIHKGFDKYQWGLWGSSKMSWMWNGGQVRLAVTGTRTGTWQLRHKLVVLYIQKWSHRCECRQVLPEHDRG